MKYNKDKIILVDCDGVLLDWMYAFDLWLQERGYTKNLDESEYDRSIVYNTTSDKMKELIGFFNSSAAIGFLPPLRDAMYYVRKLFIEHGYVFHAITSLSKDKHAQELRTQNLKMLFGKRTFEKFVYLDTGEDKTEALTPYKDSGCFWIEDKLENAQVGRSLGLNSIVVGADHNATSEFPRYWKWKDVYNHIIDSQSNQ